MGVAGKHPDVESFDGSVRTHTHDRGVIWRRCLAVSHDNDHVVFDGLGQDIVGAGGRIANRRFVPKQRTTVDRPCAGYPAHRSSATRDRYQSGERRHSMIAQRIVRACPGYAHSTTSHQFQTGTRVPLAKIVTAAGAITGVTDLRKPLAWLNERSEILVGPVGSLGVHFDSVGAALRYVAENLAPTLGTATRNYRIRVVGHVVESDAPLVIPANGIVIQGLGGDSTAPATPGKSVIEWTGDAPLFDLNGKDYLIFRDFVAGYNGTTAAATAADRRAVFYANAQASSHCVFENIRVKNYGSSANTLHGAFYVAGTLGAITNSVIRDVYATGALIKTD